MPLSDDIAMQTESAINQTMPAVKELANALLNYLKGKENPVKTVEEKLSNSISKANSKYLDTATGLVSKGRFLNSGEKLLMAKNISIKDVDALVEKSKLYNIPIAFKGKGGETVTAILLESHKDPFQKMIKEVLKDKLALKPDDCLSFKVNSKEADIISDLCKKNDIPLTVINGADGEIHCVYEAKDTAKMNIIKSDCKAVEKDISENLSTEKIGNKIKLSDREIGKSITLSSLPTRAKLERVMQEQFGYSSEKAVAAAHKFEKQLSGDSLTYFKTDNRQAMLMNNYERNIRLADDTIVTRPYSFTRANFVSENVNHYLVSDGDRTVKLTPSQMTTAEMTEAVRTKLGITDTETINAIVDKTQKVDTLQKIKDLKAEKGLKGENLSIERLTNNRFTVEQNGRKQMYSLQNRKEALAEIKADFKLSDEKASRIFDKAKHQNAISNELKKASVKAPKINKKDISVGARR